MSVIWCAHCGSPLDCPEHPEGVPHFSPPDDYSIEPCGCLTPVCVCGPADLLIVSRAIVAELRRYSSRYAVERDIPSDRLVKLLAEAADRLETLEEIVRESAPVLRATWEDDG